MWQRNWKNWIAKIEVEWPFVNLIDLKYLQFEDSGHTSITRNTNEDEGSTAALNAVLHYLHCVNNFDFDMVLF